MFFFDSLLGDQILQHSAGLAPSLTQIHQDIFRGMAHTKIIPPLHELHVQGILLCDLGVRTENAECDFDTPLPLGTCKDPSLKATTGWLK